MAGLHDDDAFYIAGSCYGERSICIRQMSLKFRQNSISLNVGYSADSVSCGEWILCTSLGQT